MTKIIEYININLQNPSAKRLIPKISSQSKSANPLKIKVALAAISMTISLIVTAIVIGRPLK